MHWIYLLFWDLFSEAISLDNDSSEVIGEIRNTDNIGNYFIKLKETGASKYFNKFSNKLTKYGYKVCEGVNYFFNGMRVN